MDGMAWIPGATFLMGSDRHYPEEAPGTQGDRGRVLDRGLPLRRAGTTTSARRRAMIPPAMHGARRPVKRDRGVLSDVISIN
jgi:hypothetical protein